MRRRKRKEKKKKKKNCFGRENSKSSDSNEKCDTIFKKNIRKKEKLNQFIKSFSDSSDSSYSSDSSDSCDDKKQHHCFFLKVLRSSRSLVVGLSVDWSVRHFCEKVTFGVSNGN